MGAFDARTIIASVAYLRYQLSALRFLLANSHQALPP